MKWWEVKRLEEKRKVSCGTENYRSKGVAVNCVIGGLGVDMQDCLEKRMGIRNK